MRIFTLLKDEYLKKWQKATTAKIYEEENGEDVG
jgi:hypothetical protein